MKRKENCSGRSLEKVSANLERKRKSHPSSLTYRGLLPVFCRVPV